MIVVSSAIALLLAPVTGKAARAATIFGGALAPTGAVDTLVKVHQVRSEAGERAR